MHSTSNHKALAKSATQSFLAITLVAASTVMLTGCFQSEADKCIDQQSSLWDNRKNADNKAYWDAVARCKEKHR